MTTFWQRALGSLVGATVTVWLSAGSASAADPRWEPRPVPPQCVVANVHVLLQDISGSMNRLLGPALEQQALYVERAPNCTYVIYGEFGLTARIVADGFLVSPEERARLAAEIRSRPPTQSHTNFDEGGALVELTLLKVERAYSEVPWSFTVSAISDRIPSPSEGHEPFDLQAYLAQRRLGTRVGVLRVELVRQGTAPTAEEVRSAPGRLTAPVGSLSEVLQAAVVPPEPPAVAPTAAVDEPHPAAATPEEAAARRPPDAAREASGGPDPRGWSVPVSAWVAAGALVLLIALLMLVRARRSGPALLAENREKHQLFEDRVPRALRVTEQVVDKAGAVTETLRHRIEVPVAVNVPVVFAADLSADVPLRPVPGLSAARALTITPEEDGQLRVQGARGLTCNGAAVPPAGTIVDPATPVRVGLADRRWQVVAVFEDAARVDDLLATPDRTALAQGPQPAGREVVA